MGILEAPFYKIPVVNVGNRQMGRLNAGNVEFVNYDFKTIYSAIEKACFNENYLNEINLQLNPYGDGDSVKKILDILLELDLSDNKWYVKKKLC